MFYHLFIVIDWTKLCKWINWYSIQKFLCTIYNYQTLFAGSLHLHDIQHCGSGSAEDTESGALERTVVTPLSNPASFSWHPMHVNRLLAISQNGMQS